MQSTRATVVLDVGKSLAKISLWAPDGALLERRTRPNPRIDSQHYLALDTAGIETWLARTLHDYSRIASIGRLIPLSHGAAAAVVQHGRLLLPPLDYEHPIPLPLHREYDADREPFALTGSPALPDGLNLGAQLHFLQTLFPELLSGEATILPWAQYWSWLLSGRAASEVTSLGCHTDLWHPLAAGYSRMATWRGWAQRFAPLARAEEVLGVISPVWARRTGLPSDVEVHCGLHDSNAALVAARAFPEFAGRDMTVLSTGTWFVALRTPSGKKFTRIAALPESRDCLVNVDAFGQPIPSARFMGGREIEILLGAEASADPRSDSPAMLAAIEGALAADAMILPTYAPGTGPYGGRHGRWWSMPDDLPRKRAAVFLYAALMVDASLDLIGAVDCLLVEGRFARCDVFVHALATLRPDMSVHVTHAHSDVAFGALKLLNPKLAAAGPLIRVPPLDVRLDDYRNRWRQRAEATN